MAVVLLNDTCVHRNDPCKPKWRLSIDDIKFIDTDADRTQHRNCQNKSMKTAMKLLLVGTKSLIILYKFVIGRDMLMWNFILNKIRVNENDIISFSAAIKDYKIKTVVL